MLKVDSKLFEKVVLQIVGSTDIRKLSKEFLKDTVFFYSILKDISKGKDSLNYRMLKKIAKDKKISEEFIVDQARLIISCLFPNEPKDDYYKILNVTSTATTEEIRKSWLKLVKAHHPDRLGNEGLDITKKLNEAYEVLSNPVKRSEYDSKRIPVLPVVVRGGETTKRMMVYSFSVLAIFALMFYFWQFSPFFKEKEFAKKSEDIEPSKVPPTKIIKREEKSKSEEAQKSSVEVPKASLLIATPNPERETPPILTYRKDKLEEIQTAQIEEKPKEQKEGRYIVKEGDNLWLIAKRFNLSVKELRELNNLKNDKLGVGDVLIVSRTYKVSSASLEPKEKPVAKKEATIEEKKKREDVEGSSNKVASIDLNKGEKEKAEQNDKPKIQTASFRPNEASLYLFVSEYVAAYKNRDFNKFISLFDPDARENGTDLKRTTSSYKKNFSNLEIITYDVSVKNINLTGERAYLGGDFIVTFRNRNKGEIKRLRGEINWSLLWRDSDWKIKEISYRIKDSR